MAEEKNTSKTSHTAAVWLVSSFFICYSVIQITQNGAKTALSGKIPKSDNLQWERTTCLPDYSDWH